MPLEQVGRYRVTGRAYQGKGCLRYPAVDTVLGREVILRTSPSFLSGDAQVQGRLLAQARHLARLRHPNIASLLDVVEADGRVFQVLPRESGKNLAWLVRKGRPAEVDWSLRLAAGLCDGLSYVHAEGVIHGRLAAESVFLREDETPVLVGFEPDSSSIGDPLLLVGTVVENARYLAPEVVRKERADARTDLWSLGVLLFHLLTGHYPQSGRDAVAVMEETSGGKPCPAIATFRDDLPAGVATLVDHLLQKDPARRPRAAEDVHAAIEALLGGEVDPSAAARTVRLPEVRPEGLRRYAILERVGSGAFGVVFRARARETGEMVALKFLRPDLADDPNAAARFRREVEVARAIDHPNVVRVIDAGRDGDAAYVAMEFIDGPSLAARLRSEGRLPWREAARIGAEVLDALAAAHARSVVHRDLKPANIVLRGGETPVILDFGMSHLEDATRLTHVGDVLGTPAYMAPEQIEGRGADPRSDLYAVGAILYEMLAGRPPFSAESLPELCRKVCDSEPPALDADVPDAIRSIAMGLLLKDPGLRSGPAALVRDSLRRLLS